MSRLILITGSREATPEMIGKAREIVVWVHDVGYAIIVGEAPGVDEEVRQACWSLRMAPFVMGAKNHFRQTEINPTREQRHIIHGGYYARDRLMGDRASACVALWNGRKRATSGTVYTGLYVESLGKPVRWPFASPHTVERLGADPAVDGSRRT
jgi:hypothetical protein